MAIVDDSRPPAVGTALDAQPVRVDARARTGRIALAHDWLVGLRGGELVLDRLASLIRSKHEPAGLYTMFARDRALTPELAKWQAFASPLDHLPAGARRWLLPAYPSAVRSLSKRLARDHAREPIDLLLSSSSAAIKGLKPPKSVPHVCYCHAPARYIWNQQDAYRNAGGPAALGLRLAGPAYRRWDRATSTRVTRFLANSRFIADQIRTCFGRQATVVHPPVRTDTFTPDPATPRQSHWLAIGALVPYKRFDLAIAAAKAAGAELTIIGDGPDRDRLLQLAGSGVTFLGSVDEPALIEHLRRARLLIYPQVEDFGITAVEAQACGCPVLARRAGGALETVIDGTTGVLFEGDGPAEIARAADRVPPDSPELRSACRSNAERFSEARFDRAIATIIDQTLS